MAITTGNFPKALAGGKKPTSPKSAPKPAPKSGGKCGGKCGCK